MEYLKKLLGQKDPNAAEEFFTADPVMLQGLEDNEYQQRPQEEAYSELQDANVDRILNKPYAGESYSPEEEAEATRQAQEMADNAEAERVAFEAQQSQPERSPAAEPPKSRDQMLLEEFQKLRKGSDEELKSARNMDLLSSAFNTLNPILENRRRAKAMQSAQSIGADPGSLNMPKFDTDSASKTLAERQAKINELLKEQKLMAALQPKSMSKLDEAKIRESEAKAKLYESKATGEGQSSKEEVKIREENRKEKKKIKTDTESTEKLIKTLENAKKEFDSYSKNSVGGTGPLATGAGLKKHFSSDLELLDATFKEQNLDTMAKLFQGMSKAVDSDAERRAFEAAQPSITNDDSTNKRILERRLESAKSLLAKQREALESTDDRGNITKKESSNKSPTKQVVKKQYSASKNKTKIIYADGTEEIVHGQQ